MKRDEKRVYNVEGHKANHKYLVVIWSEKKRKKDREKEKEQ